MLPGWAQVQMWFIKYRDKEGSDTRHSFIRFDERLTYVGRLEQKVSGHLHAGVCRQSVG